MNTDLPLCLPFYHSTSREFPVNLTTSTHTIGKPPFAKVFHLGDIMTKKSTVLNLRRLFLGKTEYQYGIKFRIEIKGTGYWSGTTQTYYVNKGVILDDCGEVIATIQDDVLYIYNNFEHNTSTTGLIGLFNRLKKVYTTKYVNKKQLMKFFKFVIPRPSFKTMKEAIEYAKKLSIEMMNAQPDKFIREDVENRTSTPF